MITSDLNKHARVVVPAVAAAGLVGELRSCVAVITAPFAGCQGFEEFIHRLFTLSDVNFKAMIFAGILLYISVIGLKWIVDAIRPRAPGDPGKHPEIHSPHS